MTDTVQRVKRDQIMKRLKEETKDYHAKLESLPYFNALIAHTLPLECYVSQLRALSIIHGVLENEIAKGENSTLAAVWDDDLRKLPLLEKDLSFFEHRVILDAESPVEAALKMTHKIRLRKIENPVTLLGYLYVLEGSTLGNRMHRPDISKTFHLEEFNGCHYYASYLEQVPSHWKLFGDKMNAALIDPSAHAAVVEAAHEAFSGLEVLYTALYPFLPAQRKYHVTRINPEAGNHPIPEDEREIQAALRASDRGWAQFGYYAQRFGKRGKRFSDSDTCWLATLTGLDPQTLGQQIDWLCRVLAARGMPTIMMEQTLRFLAEELRVAVPENGPAYEKLDIAAAHLQKARENRISPSTFEALADEFEQSVGDRLAEIYRNTGQLLVSAVVDDANGLDGTIEALCQWLTDTERFSAEWIRALRETVGKAKTRLAGGRRPLEA
jgi:heme oxygenase